MGISLSHALAVAGEIDQHTRAIAKSYVQMFLADVMGRDGDGRHRTPEDWERINDALQRLQPLAVDAIRAAFEQAMSELVEAEMKRFVTQK